MPLCCEKSSLSMHISISQHTPVVTHLTDSDTRHDINPTLHPVNINHERQSISQKLHLRVITLSTLHTRRNALRFALSICIELFE